MKDLIERQAAIEKLRSNLTYMQAFGADRSIDLINELPSAQQEIIRCGQCKYAEVADFIKWAVSHGYSDALTLDRINVNGNYEPSNCRWIPMSEQYKNKQSNSGKMPLPEPYREDDYDHT